MVRVAVIKIVYKDGAPAKASAIKLFSEIKNESPMSQAMGYIKQNYVVASDIKNRTELLACEVAGDVLAATNPGRAMSYG